ncbi:MAG TPA: hypothetical protein VIG33_14150 [Pseudobdellovibrionaceae bacterium]|jgi:hypothetical protein
MNKTIYLSFSLLLGFSLQASAAIPAKPLVPVVGKILINEGEATGGVAGTGFSLMDLRRTSDVKKKVERIVIDFGDMQGNPQKGLPAYFHAELKKNPNRLVLDFNQTPNSRIDDGRLATRFKDSLFVKKSSMILDPEDKALNLTLDLKPGTFARVFQVKGEKTTAKVVIDLFETKKTK